MKYIKSTYLGAAMLGALTLTGCQADMDAPGLQVPVASWQANTTIAELKEEMWSDDTNYAILCPEKNEETGEHFYIKGRVISSDATGNVYKSMYIQDETAAITLSINQNSLYNQYRLGQEVVIDVTGLYIGKYAGLEQIGGYGEYNGTPQVSFMIYPKFEEHCQLNQLPDDDVKVINYGDARPDDGMYCINMSISQLPTDTEGIRNMQSQLVEFRNVHFEEGGTNTFATYQQTESRNLLDEQGNTIVVRTSGYSNFYNQTLPTGNGTVRALLSYFNGTWQLILRSTADVMFESKGQKEDPYTIDEAIANQNMDVTGWVKGYIVGAVKGGVGTVTSNDDIIWGRDVDMDNNLVIGETADTRDFTRCVVVELKSGSDFRKVGNLLDNPGNLGKMILVRGTFKPQLGMAGVADNNGTASEFEIEGVSGPGDQPTGGDGSATNPYTVSQVQTGATGTDVWTTGYIVGYINDKSMSAETTIFTAPATMASNVVIAASPTETNYLNCIPVQLVAGTEARTKLNLMDNPGNLGAKVALKGNLEKYFGVAGIKNVTEYTLDGTTPNPDPNPNPNPDPNPGDTPDLQAPVTLAAADATGFKGTHFEEEPKTETSNGQAERWQPLEGLTIGNYTFTFGPGTGTNKTAWYNVMSTAASGTPTLRFYTGSTMTINAPAGSKIAKVVMTGSNANNALTVTSDNGTCVRDGNNVTWTSSTGTSAVTWTFSATYRVSSMEVYLVK